MEGHYPAELTSEHTPEAANQGLTRHTRNLKEGVFLGKLELNSAVALQDRVLTPLF